MKKLQKLIEQGGHYNRFKPVHKLVSTENIQLLKDLNDGVISSEQYATATIDIFAQATQSANNGNTAMDAQGWPKV